MRYLASSSPSMMTAGSNHISFWLHEDVGIGVAPGVDGIAFALQADVDSTTLRPTPQVAQSRHPLQTKHASLKGVAGDYRKSTAAWVALRMQYPVARGVIRRVFAARSCQCNCCGRALMENVARFIARSDCASSHSITFARYVHEFWMLSRQSGHRAACRDRQVHRGDNDDLISVVWG
jgi:hypothetical protein